MDISLEAYRNIVRNVARRRDVAALCGVNRAFRNAAERALYNTLTVSDEDPRACETLAASPRIASLVVALTVQFRRRHNEEEGRDRRDSEPSSVSESGEERSASRSSSRARPIAGASATRTRTPDDSYWPAVARALRNTTRLRHLTVDIADPDDCGGAWVLEGCVFQLRTFHCDFDWDHALCAFLAMQSHLHDLSLRDYRELEDLAAAEVDDGIQPATVKNTNPLPPGRHHESDETTAEPPSHILEHPISPGAVPPPIASPALPALATLECTFSEAAVVLVPGRPLTRLKTCFSRSDSAGKRAELVALLGALRRSTVALRALDIADVSYTESGSMELLHRISHTQTTSRELRYLGTLALPISGRKRLHFYGLLMRLSLLRCIEVDVSAWSPPPSSSPAFRALAAELRLYCPDVDTVVFVHEFERTVVNTGGTGVLRIDDNASPELFWREI
ncbi:hypothetical protein B0H14DRAFT_2450343 [Mycena olivaceomarginata]|nr:hypothetical protein B0H14DRAFT_2450343 [Mycena olivaceomarginata]